MILAYPAPISSTAGLRRKLWQQGQNNETPDDESGTLYLILGVLSIVAVFGCRLYRERQNGIGINAGARAISSRRNSVFPGWLSRRGVNRRKPIMGFEV